RGVQSLVGCDYGVGECGDRGVAVVCGGVLSAAGADVRGGGGVHRRGGVHVHELSGGDGAGWKWGGGDWWDGVGVVFSVDVGGVVLSFAGDGGGGAVAAGGDHRAGDGVRDFSCGGAVLL